MSTLNRTLAAKNMKGRKQAALRKKKLAEKKKLEEDAKRESTHEHNDQSNVEHQPDHKPNNQPDHQPDYQPNNQPDHVVHRDNHPDHNHHDHNHDHSHQGDCCLQDSLEEMYVPAVDQSPPKRSWILDLDGDVCPARAKSYSSKKTLAELLTELKPHQLQEITYVRLPCGLFGDDDAPEILAFTQELPSLKYIDLSEQHLCGQNAKALLSYLLNDRAVYVDLYNSPSFMRVVWQMIADMPVLAIQRLRWLTWQRVNYLDGEWLEKFYGTDKAYALRAAHNKEYEDIRKVLVVGK